MNAKSDTQLQDLVYNEIIIFFGSFLKTLSLEIIKLIEEVKEIKENTKTLGCGTSRFRVMVL